MVPFVKTAKKIKYAVVRLVKKLGASGAAKEAKLKGIDVSPSTAATWAKEYGVVLKRGRRPLQPA